MKYKATVTSIGSPVLLTDLGFLFPLIFLFLPIICIMYRKGPLEGKFYSSFNAMNYFNYTTLFNVIEVWV